MPINRPIDVVCLDLDDTLIDTQGSMRAQLGAAAVAARHLVPSLSAATIEFATETALRMEPNLGRLAHFAKMLGIEGEERLAELEAAYWSVIPDALELQTGTAATLTALRERFALVIVTNGPSDRQRAKIRKLGLADLVDGIVISEEVGFEKPDARVFEIACDLVSASNERAAHVGDSPRADILGAKRAGLFSIWLRPPTHREWPANLQADATIDRLSDLSSLLGN